MAERWGVTNRMIVHYCDNNLIPRAVKKGTLWLIPTMSEKPLNRKQKSNSDEKETE